MVIDLYCKVVTCSNVLEWTHAQTQFFLGDMDVGGMLIGLVHLDQAMYVCFQQRKLPTGEVLLNIWFELVAWLRGWYDSIQRDPDEAEKGLVKVSI